MFKCQECGRTTDTGEKQYTKILKTRDRVYDVSYIKVIRQGRRKRKIKKDFQREGWEIVKEQKVCEQCYTTWQAHQKEKENKC